MILNFNQFNKMNEKFKSDINIKSDLNNIAEIENQINKIHFSQVVDVRIITIKAKLIEGYSQATILFSNGDTLWVDVRLDDNDKLIDNSMIIAKHEKPKKISFSKEDDGHFEKDFINGIKIFIQRFYKAPIE